MLIRLANAMLVRLNYVIDVMIPVHRAGVGTYALPR
jgi:hypothetical protein